MVFSTAVLSAPGGRVRDINHFTRQTSVLRSRYCGQSRGEGGGENIHDLPPSGTVKSALLLGFTRCINPGNDQVNISPKKKRISVYIFSVLTNTVTLKTEISLYSSTAYLQNFMQKTHHHRHGY